jgi:hypothetical protein
MKHKIDVSAILREEQEKQERIAKSPDKRAAANAKRSAKELERLFPGAKRHLKK